MEESILAKLSMDIMTQKKCQWRLSVSSCINKNDIDINVYLSAVVDLLHHLMLVSSMKCLGSYNHARVAIYAIHMHYNIVLLYSFIFSFPVLCVLY